ncbi:MAG: metal ABC transporter ATP-binding protein [Elusimicrobia bacterium]|nr:metal ABC transporter ATP-binding protein [Elusimicrobiota bacterium]
MKPEPLLRLENAAFGYDGRRIVRDVELAVAPGDFLGVAGPNGSGKSTLLKGLLGLLKPLSGTVFRSPALGRALGWVPQRDALDAVFPLTALDIARLGRGLVLPWHARLGAKDEALARRCLATVGLSGKAEAPFQTLSGGQRQRALIARALAVEPRLLVLDEPTAGVDPEAEESIMTLLKDLTRSKEMAVVMVTHQQEHLKDAATRVVMVRDGRLRARTAP